MNPDVMHPTKEQKRITEISGIRFFRTVAWYETADHKQNGDIREKLRREINIIIIVTTNKIIIIIIFYKSVWKLR